ncbi:MAG TPA: hypothetical protein PLV96_10210 [Methanoregulaceae archaeon]|nr:hypothetical protein [Methanoregulaceae archaeon]HQA81156.1 hypothetical protein [Methanoregulaceae archaeon]
MKITLDKPVLNPQMIDIAITDLVNNSHRDDFREIIAWTIRTGLGEKEAREQLINTLATCISKELSNGLVQVSIQQLEEETEIKAMYEQSLQPIYPRVDFIVKFGAFDVWTTTYWFKVMSTVKLDNLSVRLKKDEITGFQSGTMQAFVTLAYCGLEKENPEPFTLFEKKNVLEVKLPEVVRFE